MMDIPANKTNEEIVHRYLTLKGQMGALVMIDMEVKRLVKTYSDDLEEEGDKKNEA